MAYTQLQKDQIAGKGMWMGTNTNQNNCAHLPELIAIAKAELYNAERMPGKTAALEKVRNTAIEQAKQVLEEREQKLALYKEIFPDLFA